VIEQIQALSGLQQIQVGRFEVKDPLIVSYVGGSIHHQLVKAFAPFVGNHEYACVPFSLLSILLPAC
jgi:hypothetical protein